MANEGNIAAAALFIAIVALLIASAQLLQQLFSTADGHRRCQSSVIGEWSKSVRRKFRWTALRFEVRFTTPHFEIRALKDTSVYERTLDINRAIPLTGAMWSLRPTYSQKDDENEEDTVSWTGLLRTLHNRQEPQVLEYTQIESWMAEKPTISNFGPRPLKPRPELKHAALVCVTCRTRSWDLMPPDVIRPVASTTLGTLINLAHRLGMTWRELDPQGGKMRAEAVGQSLAAIRMRGMGLVVEFHQEKSLVTKSRKAEVTSMRIPSIDGDKMACGIIPGSREFPTWDIPIRGTKGGPDMDLIVDFLDDQRLRIPDDAIQAIRSSVGHHNAGTQLCAFVDLLGTWSDWLPLPNHNITEVPCPFTWKLFPMGEVYEAHVVWRWHLQQLSKQISLSKQMQKVLEHYDTWHKEYQFRFDQYFWPTGNQPEEVGYSVFLKTIFDDMTNSLKNLCKKHDNLKAGEKSCSPEGSFFVQLIASHISVNASSLRQADELLKGGHGRNDERVGCKLQDEYFTERAFLYADNLPHVRINMLERGFSGEDVEDAWWLLMLRSQAWAAAINRLAGQGGKVPSSYYASPTKVYIL